jgi:hypothetical protein
VSSVHLWSSIQPELGVPIQLTVTYDAFNRVARIYVNGESAAEGGDGVCDTLDCVDGRDGLITSWPATGAFNVGKWTWSGSTVYWPGLVDDVYAYQGVLTDRDAADLASNVVP